MNKKVVVFGGGTGMSYLLRGLKEYPLDITAVVSVCDDGGSTGILRDEWGFGGIVTSDWWNHSEHYIEIKAGNDVKMMNGYPERVKEALDKGAISVDDIKVCAKRVLEMILKMD